MVDRTDDPKRVRRLEVIDVGGRRRRWSDEEKARIVAESLAPGAVVAEIARRHDTRAQQVHGWRKDAREGRLVLPAERQDLVSFAPVIVAPAAPAKPTRPPASRCGSIIAIEAPDIIVRVSAGAEVNLVEAVIRAVRARA